MAALIFIFRSFVNILLSAVLFAMAIRIILSLFVEEDNKLLNFLYAFTEPFIMPVRAVMERFNILQNSPIDFSYLITHILLSIIIIIIG